MRLSEWSRRLPDAFRGVSLRTKVAAVVALIAAGVALGVGALAYGAASTLIQVNAEQRFDSVVEQVATELREGGMGPEGFQEENGAEVLQQEGLSVQGVRSDGTIMVLRGTTRHIMPVTPGDLNLAAAVEPGRTLQRGTVVDGRPYRVATISVGGGGGALQLSQELTRTEQLLQSLRQRMALLAAVVVLVGGAAGWFVGHRVTRRLVRLTATAERVSSTGRLDTAVPEDGTSGSDEVGRLATAFNAMLARLAGARAEQRRLVQDAAHELRTPLTSLRTNVSLLRRLERLPPESRDRLIEDLQGETRELSDLVNELVELATDQRSDEPVRSVALADTAERVAARSRRRTGHEIVVRADGTVVAGRPHALERALSNVVDNAAKFASDPHRPIEIAVEAGRVEVRDRGPGIAPADIDRLFDRFYRATASRSAPGSGLGLAIVRDIVHQHGGEVFAHNREDGGAVIGFTLPTVHA